MTVKIAIIGSGAIAPDHVNALARDPRAVVKYVVGSDPARAAAVAALAPGALALTDPAAALADPEVDAVNIVSATPEHARWTIAAGQAGKDVHVEKPAALSLADFDAMVAATEGAGHRLMVGQTVRFQPAVTTLQRRIADGAVGRPRMVHVSWYTGHVWPNGWRGWQHDPAKSGGHPVHNGTHALDLVTWLIGQPPVRVFARDFPTFAARMPVPDSFQILVRFADGSLATIELCYALSRRGQMLRRLLVAGTEGTLLHDTDADPYVDTQGTRSAPPSIEDAMGHQMRHWLDTLTGAAAPIVRTVQVRAALAAALAAQQSLVTGDAVSIDAGNTDDTGSSR